MSSIGIIVLKYIFLKTQNFDKDMQKLTKFWVFKKNLRTIIPKQQNFPLSLKNQRINTELTFWKCKLKFESTSLGSMLSCNYWCITFKASNFIMVLISSLIREPKQSTTKSRLKICLKSHVGNSRVTWT